MKPYLAILLLACWFSQPARAVSLGPPTACGVAGDSLFFRESTPRAQYERTLRAIEESREGRRIKESAELRALIDAAIRNRNSRKPLPGASIRGAGVRAAGDMVGV